MKKGMLILISGSPLSGKSTICRKMKDHFKKDSVLLSTDEFRRHMTGSYGDYSKEHAVWAEIVRIALKNLKRKKIVILDATLRQRDLRMKHLEYYKKYEIYYIAFEQLPFSVLLERNSDRSEKKLTESRLKELYDGYQLPTEDELKLYQKSVVINNENSEIKLNELISYIEERRSENNGKQQ
jgi:predicted kinase